MILAGRKRAWNAGNAFLESALQSSGCCPLPEGVCSYPMCKENRLCWLVADAGWWLMQAQRA